MESEIDLLEDKNDDYKKQLAVMEASVAELKKELDECRLSASQ